MGTGSEVLETRREIRVEGRVCRALELLSCRLENRSNMPLQGLSHDGIRP